MKKHSILFVILSLMLCAGCYNEDALTPTTEPEPGYVLPDNGLACDAEIAEYYSRQPAEMLQPRPMRNALVVGIYIERDLRRARISHRLRQRLDEGMVEEIKSLLEGGIPPESLIYYGLEYKFVTEYLIGKLSYDEMVERLEIAIHQFAKRQMTWFRGMERRGIPIHWIDATLPTDDKVGLILDLIQQQEGSQPR